MHFDARVVLVDVFVEVGFDDAVVVEAEPLAEGVLRDLEPAIHVSSEARRKENLIERASHSDWSPAIRAAR